MFEQYKTSQTETAAAEIVGIGDEASNEINSEIEVQNTNHHKAIIKARNEFYNVYKKRFIDQIKDIMSTYDNYRTEEIRFSNYWANNLKEITKKHI